MGESVQQSSTQTSLTSGVVEPLFSRNCSSLSEVQGGHNANGGGGVSAHLSTGSESLTTSPLTSTDIIGTLGGLVQSRVEEWNRRSTRVAPISRLPSATTSFGSVRAKWPPGPHVHYEENKQLATIIESLNGAMLLEDRRHYEGIKFTPTAKLDDKQMRVKTDRFHVNLTGGLCVGRVRRDFQNFKSSFIDFAFWTDFSAVRCIALQIERLRFVDGASKHTVYKGEYQHFLGAIAAVHDEASGELRHLLVVESCPRKQREDAGSSPDDQRARRQDRAPDAVERLNGPHQISIRVLRSADRQGASVNLRFENQSSVRLGDTDVGCHTNACAIGARVFASYSHSRFVFRLDVHPSGDGLDLRHADVGSNVRSLASDPKLHVVAALLRDGTVRILDEQLVEIKKYPIRYTICVGDAFFNRNKRYQYVSIEPKLIAFMRLGPRHRPCVLVVFLHKLNAMEAAAENGARNGRDSDKCYDSIDVYDMLSGEWLSELSPDEFEPLAAVCVFPSERTRAEPAASAAAACAGDRGFLVLTLESLSAWAN